MNKILKLFRGYVLSGLNIILTKNASDMNTILMRVAKYWNKISDDVKLSADVDQSKIKLDNYKKERFEVKGNYWVLSDGIFDRYVDL